jgi:hypothetical protein
MGQVQIVDCKTGTRPPVLAHFRRFLTLPSLAFRHLLSRALTEIPFCKSLKRLNVPGGYACQLGVANPLPMPKMARSSRPKADVSRPPAILTSHNLLRRKRLRIVQSKWLFISAKAGIFFATL